LESKRREAHDGPAAGDAVSRVKCVEESDGRFPLVYRGQLSRSPTLFRGTNERAGLRAESPLKGKAPLLLVWSSQGGRLGRQSGGARNSSLFLYSAHRAQQEELFRYLT